MTRENTPNPEHLERVLATAERFFGHDSLLPGQQEAMCALLEGRDVLLVSPTGSGKSLSYQVAGVLLEGCTVVVSPLLALQHDQMQGLGDEHPELHSARISSAESEGHRDDVLAKALAGELEFLFLSPEQLANPEVRGALARVSPSLVAVDEAHCVSTWGHDFRPDYHRLGELIADLGSPAIIAMTATAALPVRDDIVERLRLRDHELVVTGFERENIALDVVRVTEAGEQVQTVLERVAASDGAGIVYCRTRRSAEEYGDALAAAGRRVAVYHAGLSKKVRAAAHEAFLSGEVDVVVATSAFGMGIDKPDIRFVVHAQVPESPDTYYQEVGRAGRDGEPASAVLVYRSEDLSLGKFFSGGVPSDEDVAKVVKASARLDDDVRGDARLEEVSRRSGFGPRKAGRLLNLVDEVRDSGTESGAGKRMVAAVRDRAEAYRKLRASRVDMMRGYAETDRCRSAYLLAYFGEPAEQPCGRCDNCRSGVAGDEVAEHSVFRLQSRVTHDEFGDGVVTDVEEDRVTVLFEDVGYRTLSLELVEEHGLLEPAG